MTNESLPPSLAGLLAPAAYPHEVEPIQLRETHISWVLLTGPFAYKLKKPVNLGFADFSTLDRRRHYCEEELRLNQQFASDLYLDVVPVADGPTGLKISGSGTPIDYAVRMRQFDERQLASRRLAEGRLGPGDIDELAVSLATVHARAGRSDEQMWGTAKQIKQPVVANFAVLRPLVDDSFRSAQLDAVSDWSLRTCENLAATFESRRDKGFVRECHGDLHLENILTWRGRMTLFDCIEFNPSLRWIDVMNEVAFLVMDLDRHQRPNLSARFLNAYLERTGDYAGLSVLAFYLVYRAVVRAKVDALRLQQSGLSAEEWKRLTIDLHGYLDLAESYTGRPQLSLTITHGFSGSGKTTGTQALLERDRAIRIRSDVERKRLREVALTDDVDRSSFVDIYSPSATEDTYNRLSSLARMVILNGFPVVVDATFLMRAQRQLFHDLAMELGVPFQIVEFAADDRELRKRIQRRQRDGDDASDATTDVLDHQISTAEPLTVAERARVIISPAALRTVPESTPDS